MKQLLFLLIVCAARLQAVETFETASGPVKITAVQHATVMIEAAGKIIYVDPAQGKIEGMPLADMILITDIHGDHMSQPNIDKIKREGTVIFGPPAVVEKMDIVNSIPNGQSKTWEGWTIEAVPAYNLTRGPSAGQLYHDKGRGNGYVLTFGGKRFYFSGDTEAVPEMLALKNIDAAFVCMNLPFTMTPQEAAAAVKAFHPAVVYPYHHRGSDLKAFEAGLKDSGVEVRILEWYPK